MHRVHPAEPYRYGQLGSMGKARYMLLAQFDFPDTFEDHEAIASNYSDRLEGQYPDRVARSIVNMGVNDHNFNDYSTFEQQFRLMSRESLIDFIARLLDVIGRANWTGCRVAAGVDGYGHTLFHFMLFARDPNGETLVYTGEPAPNVLLGPRR